MPGEKGLTRLCSVQPLTAHGDFSATKKKRTPLTSTAEAALKKHLQQNPRADAEELLGLLPGLQAEVVPEAWLMTWAKNHRPKPEQNAPKRTKFGWIQADWRQVERDLGLMSTLFEAPPAEWPNCFKFAAATYDPECTAVAFVTPALLKATMDALCKLSFVKLCGDGTYHLTHESWALLSIGALTKHYVRDGSSYAFRTTFSPLMFANKESDENYDLLFKATVDCAKQVSGVDLAQAMC